MLFYCHCSGQPSDFEFLKVIGKGTFGKVSTSSHQWTEIAFLME